MNNEFKYQLMWDKIKTGIIFMNNRKTECVNLFYVIKIVSDLLAKITIDLFFNEIEYKKGRTSKM